MKYSTGRNLTPCAVLGVKILKNSLTFKMVSLVRQISIRPFHQQSSRA